MCRLCALQIKWERLGKLALLPGDCLPPRVLDAALPTQARTAPQWRLMSFSGRAD
jgi:hypothetical protein